MNVDGNMGLVQKVVDAMPRALRVYVVLAWAEALLATLAIAVWVGKFCWHFALFSKLVGVQCACEVCPFVNDAWWVIPVVVCALAVHVVWTRLTVRRICEGNGNLLIAEWIAAVPILACSVCMCCFLIEIPGGLSGITMAILSPLAIFPCENLLSMLTLLGGNVRTWMNAHRGNRKVGRIVAWLLGIFAARSAFLFAILAILLLGHSIRGCSQERCDILTEAINIEVPDLVPNLASTRYENGGWARSRTKLEKELFAELNHNKEFLSHWAGSNNFVEEKDLQELRILFENIHIKHPRSGFDICLAEILCELSERMQSNKEMLESLEKVSVKVDEIGARSASDLQSLEQELSSARNADDALSSARSHSFCQDIVNDVHIDNRLRVLAMRQLARMDERSGKIDDAIRWHLRIRELSFDDMGSVRALHDLTIDPWRVRFVK